MGVQQVNHPQLHRNRCRLPGPVKNPSNRSPRVVLPLSRKPLPKIEKLRILHTQVIYFTFCVMFNKLSLVCKKPIWIENGSVVLK